MKTPGSLPGTVIAIFVLALLLTAALIAPWLAPYDGSAITGDLWQPMSAQHWLGTDNLGRDLFSRLLYGTRLTLLFAFAIALLAMIAGTLISFLAVSLGGRK
ncbi:ABC transporter permease, partial [Erwinia sp. MYb416]